MLRNRVAIATVFVIATLIPLSAVWALSGSNKEPLSSPGKPEAYAPKIDSLRSGKDAKDDIAKVQSGLDRTVINSLRLASPPGDINRAGLWMYGTAFVADSPEDSSVLPFWEANLAQGAIADLVASRDASNLANVVAGSTVIMADGPRKGEALPTDASDISPGQVFKAQDGGWSDEEIAAQVETVGASFGLRTDTRVLHPLGPAPLVVATAINLDLFNGGFDEVMSAIQGQGNYEGIFLRVQLPNGQVIAEASRSYRTGGGGLWFADGYDEVLGITHFGVPRLPTPSE